MHPEDCFVCRKHRGIEPSLHGLVDPVYEDELVFLSHAQPWAEAPTQYRGYLFLETRRHAPGLGDLTDDEARAIGLWSKRAAEALVAVAGVEHVYSFIQGDGVPHLHVHLIGRYPGTPREHWGFEVPDWPAAPRGDMDDIAILSRRLRDHLQSH